MHVHPLQVAAEKNRPEVDLRSEEVQEILGQMPRWTIRWGITVISFIVLMLLLASWFVKYPDAINARVVLTTQTPPASLIARTEGRLEFYVHDNQLVHQGDYLAVLENPARTEDVRQVESQLADFRKVFYQADSILTLTTRHAGENLVLGELQAPYVSFLNSLRDFQRTRALLSHDKQMTGIHLRLRQYEQLNRQLEKQHQLMSEEMELTRKHFLIDKQLLDQKVLANADFDRSKNTYLQAQRAFEASQDPIISNQIITSQLYAQITELQLGKADQEARLKNNVESAFKALESQLASWKQRYLIQTPLSGQAAFVKYRSNNQFVRAGEEVLIVIPLSGELYGQVHMPVAGSGKVAVGQRVYMRFDNYPAIEYGQVTGQIATISPIPREGQYVIQIELPRHLTTSYGKKLEFRQEMQGNAEIVTEDLRLIQRIFNQLRALLDDASH